MITTNIAAQLIGYSMEEQIKITKCVDHNTAAPTKRMQETVDAIIKIIDESPIQPAFEGYAGFPIDKEAIDKNKRKSPDDRNIGRVVSHGGDSMVITGRKSDGRYIVVGKKGEKTAKHQEDIGVQGPKESVDYSIDIEDLHNLMKEAMTVTNADKKGNTPAWQNYKKGMKSKTTGKPMYKAADHVKEDENYGYDKKGNSLNPKDKKKKKELKEYSATGCSTPGQSKPKKKKKAYKEEKYDWRAALEEIRNG